mmetsp:Transcript_11022/g.25281  ORF Transcript_11022/g.25281 Transcript_11022/m.25281 type:complete len:452 (+) Transcript_11022:233-1588(+)
MSSAVADFAGAGGVPSSPLPPPELDLFSSPPLPEPPPAPGSVPGALGGDASGAGSGAAPPFGVFGSPAVPSPPAGAAEALESSALEARGGVAALLPELRLRRGGLPPASASAPPLPLAASESEPRPSDASLLVWPLLLRRLFDFPVGFSDVCSSAKAPEKAALAAAVPLRFRSGIDPCFRLLGEEALLESTPTPAGEVFERLGRSLPRPSAASRSCPRSEAWRLCAGRSSSTSGGSSQIQGWVTSSLSGSSLCSGHASGTVRPVGTTFRGGNIDAGFSIALGVAGCWCARQTAYPIPSTRAAAMREVSTSTSVQTMSEPESAAVVTMPASGTLGAWISVAPPEGIKAATFLRQQAQVVPQGAAAAPWRQPPSDTATIAETHSRSLGSSAVVDSDDGVASMVVVAWATWPPWDAWTAWLVVVTTQGLPWQASVAIGMLPTFCKQFQASASGQ